jgi:hypothetical protein
MRLEELTLDQLREEVRRRGFELHNLPFPRPLRMPYATGGDDDDEDDLTRGSRAAGDFDDDAG